MSWRPKCITDRRSQALAAEATRLMTGTTYDLYVRQRRFVRAWTVVSALAHCDRKRLQELQKVDRHARGQRWPATLAYLATELAIRASTDEELARIQREVLIPLELDMLDPARTWIGSPAQLAELLTTELHLGGRTEP